MAPSAASGDCGIDPEIAPRGCPRAETQPGGKVGKLQKGADFLDFDGFSLQFWCCSRSLNRLNVFLDRFGLGFDARLNDFWWVVQRFSRQRWGLTKETCIKAKHWLAWMNAWSRAYFLDGVGWFGAHISQYTIYVGVFTWRLNFASPARMMFSPTNEGCTMCCHGSPLWHPKGLDSSRSQNSSKTWY